MAHPSAPTTAASSDDPSRYQTPGYAGFTLPSHVVYRPDTMLLHPIHIDALGLPIVEDFGDAFGGKCFVRFPKRTAAQLHVSGPTSRLRSQQPVFGHDSMWLPDYCIRGSNALSQVETSRRARSTTA